MTEQDRPSIWDLATQSNGGSQDEVHRFASVPEVREGLRSADYLADEGIAGVVYLADRLGKPVLVEGPAGTGKTELAKAVARFAGSRLIRLQCYEGLDESKALYEWNYKKQLLRIQAERISEGGRWTEIEEDIFSEEFLLTRPLLEAIRSSQDVVLLIDEVDRVEVETEALLLEVLSDYQVSIPELGTVSATQIPLVFLTSNNTRELSEALKRRCLYLHIDYPTLEREREIVLAKVPGISDFLADQVARIVRSLRNLELRKHPSISETLDWARTLLILGVNQIDAQIARETMHILLKYRSDIETAAKELVTAVESYVLDVLTGFVAMLREAGLPISLTEAIDASEAVGCVPLEDREAVKYALGATLVKSSSHWKAFDTAFEVYFSLRPVNQLENLLEQQATMDGQAGDGLSEVDGSSEGKSSQQAAGTSLDSLTPEQLAAMLYRALYQGDSTMLAAIARISVERFAGMEPGRPVGGVYYLYRTLRHLDLDNVLAGLMEAARSGAPPAATGGEGDAPPGHIGPGKGTGGLDGWLDVGGLTPLEERLLREEYKARIEMLRQEIEAEIRRRLVADRGPQALARSLRRALPEDVEFMHASRDELVVMRKAVYPLARKLAARLAQRRRKGRRGPLDFRSTIRHSLAYGGVPADPRYRRPRPTKPEIFVLADISGSVSSFARFTLHLVHAIGSQFSNVRSFAFIDGVDEVTSMFESSDTIADAIHRINTEADVVWVDGHSDYGHALSAFWERWGRDITSRTSILVLGDARNNYHAPQSHILAEMRRRARHVYWLNPEPKSYWGSGDSIINHYAQFCDGVYECRNLRQLEAFVEKLA